MTTIAELAKRLETGWAMCDAERDLNHRSRLERHWLTVLAEYETACDLAAVIDMPSDQPQQSEMRVAS